MTSSVFALIKQRQADKDARKTSFKPGTFPDGQSKWRILPHASELGVQNPTKAFFQDYAIHYMKIPGDDEFAVYVCEQETFGRHCDVCEEVKKGLFGMSNWDKVAKKRTPKAGVDPKLIKVMEEMRATPRVLVNALRTDVNGNAKAEVIGLPVKVFQEMAVKAERRHGLKNINAFSSSEGLDFFVTRTGTGLDTKYEIELDTDQASVKVDPATMADLQELARASADEAKIGALQFVAKATGKPVAALTAAQNARPVTYVAPAARPANAGSAGAFAAATSNGESFAASAVIPDDDRGYDDADFQDVPESVDTRPTTATVTGAAGDLHAASQQRATATPQSSSHIDPALLAELDAVE